MLTKASGSHISRRRITEPENLTTPRKKDIKSEVDKIWEQVSGIKKKPLRWKQRCEKVEKPDETGDRTVIDSTRKKKATRRELIDTDGRLNYLQNSGSGGDLVSQWRIGEVHAIRGLLKEVNEMQRQEFLH